MKKRFRIIIKGNVQRVGFRHQVGEVAVKLGITGTATYVNHDILLEAEGAEQNLEQLLLWCRKGPKDCRVECIHVETIPVQNDESFEIVHGLIFAEETPALGA